MAEGGDPLIKLDPIDSLTIPGKIVAGQYEVVRALGEGAMGAVVLARDLELDRAVALKFLKPEVNELMDGDRRFRQEARLLSRLSHPNVVTVYSFGEDENGLRYIAMEYIDGHTLEAHIEPDFLLPLNVAGHVIRQVGFALSEAHTQGVVHRDVKPGNILLTSVAGANHYVKVVDFGLAKLSEAGPETIPGSMIGTTRDQGLALGTPAYISPEQAMGTHVDHRADVYGFAVVVMRLLTGSPLFPDVSGAMKLLMAHATQEPGTLSELGAWRGFHPGSTLEKALSRALAKDPEARYQSVDAFCAAVFEGICELEPGAPAGLFDSSEGALLTRTQPSGVALEDTLVGSSISPTVGENIAWVQQAVLVVAIDSLWMADDAIGAEDALDVLATLAGRLRHAVREAGGRANEGLRDRFVAYFHRPAGVAAAVEGAVDAALRMRQTLVGLSRDPTMPDGLAPSFRILVDVGPVVSGVTGNEGELDYGSVLVQARRAVDTVDDGVVAVSHRAHRYVRGMFVYDGLASGTGPRAVASKKQGFRARDPEIGGHPIQLIGRDQELTALVEAADRATCADSGARGVVVSGEAGVGKTRLVGEMLRAVDEGTEVVWLEAGRCSEDAAAGPYEPLSAALSERVRVRSNDDAETVRIKARAFIETRLNVTDAAFADALEATILGLLAGRTSEEDSVRGEAAQRGQFFEQVAALYRVLAEGRPLILLMDDFHHASVATRDLLAYLSGRLQDLPVLFLVIVRKSASELARSTLAREGLDVLDLSLQTLSPDASVQLIEHLLEPAREVPTGLVGRIAELSHGIPLVAEETVQDLIDNGMIEIQGDRWVFTSLSPGDIQLPDTVDALFEGRVQRLVEDQRLILEAGAIAGERFWPAMLQHVLKARWDEADLADLEAKGFVRQLDRGAIARQPAYAFVQRAMRDTIYKRVELGDRRKVHLAIAQWMEGVGAGSAIQLDASIGRHYRHGGQAARAFPYLLRAAHRATEATALEESISCLEACNEMLPQISHEDMSPEQRHQAGLKVLSDLVHQYVVSGELQKALDASREAEGYTVEDEGPARLRRDRIALDRARAHYLMGRFEEAAESFGSIDRSDTAQATTLDAAAGLAASMGKLGDPEGGITLVKEAVEAFELAAASDDGSGEHLSQAYRSWGNLALEAQALDDAEDLLMRALQYAREAHAPKLSLEALNSVAALHFFRGDLPGAVTEFRSALSVAEQWDFTQHRTMLFLNLGEALWQSGEVEESAKMLFRSETLARYVGMDGVLAESLRIRAEIKLSSELLDEAEGLARRAIEAAEATSSPRFQAPAHLVLGRTLLAMDPSSSGNPESDACVALMRAADLFEKSGQTPQANDARALVSSD